MKIIDSSFESASIVGSTEALEVFATIVKIQALLLKALTKLKERK